MDTTAAEITEMSDGQWATLFIILGISTLVFLIMLFIGWRSEAEAKGKFQKGEMRRAITALIVTVFALLAAASFFPAGPDLPPELQGAFIATVTTVIGFYFGNRSGQELPKQPPPATTAIPPTPPVTPPPPGT